MCRYPPSTIHRYLDLPSTQRILTHTSHRHKTTPPLPTLVQTPYPLPTYTTASKTQTHVQHLPCPHRIGKDQTQFSHPLTPLRAKHIHMSHTPPTPLTTLISSTSPVLDKIPEPRVLLIHTLTVTTPPRTPHQYCRHPRTLSHHTHMQHKQQYMHHSHCNNGTHNIGYYDNLTIRPRTTTGLLTPHKQRGITPWGRRAWGRRGITPRGRRGITPWGRRGITPWGRRAWGRRGITPWGRRGITPWGRRGRRAWGRRGITPWGRRAWGRRGITPWGRRGITPWGEEPGGGEG